MTKKILYLAIIIVLIIAGIFAAIKMSKENDTTQTVANVLAETNKNDKSNVIGENNTVEPGENEVVNNAENNTLKNNETTTNQQTPEEKAKQIVKENWGEDDSVYYSYDGKDENGRYVICVREKSTTKELYRYFVDIETGTFEIE